MKIATIAFMALFSFAVVSQAQDQIVGNYWTPKKDGKATIFKQGNKYFGKLYWVNIPNAKDDKNPDPKLRKRPLIGTDFITNFEYVGDGKWENGKIYDFESGNTYDCIITFKENKKDLNVRGYIGISMFGRTETFEKVND